MLPTLQEVRDTESIVSVSGVHPESAAFTGIVNKATRMLMTRGDWRGTLLPIMVCAKRGCITFPRYVESLRKVNLCGTPMEVKNVWWNFLPAETYRLNNCPWLGTSCRVQTLYQAPVYSDIYGEGRYVRAYLTNILDVNRTVTIFGEDNNGQPYQETLTLIGNGYVQSRTFVRRIDRVLKDKTKGQVILVAYEAATGSVEEVATYDASETNPSLLRVKLSVPGASCGCGTSNCDDSYSIAALAKLKFIPASDPTDLITIPSLDALELMIQAVRCSNHGDQAGRVQNEQAAIRELNLDLWNFSGDDAIVVTSDPFNGVSYLGAQQAF